MHLHNPLGDGVVAGHGMLDGRRVVCFSQDFAVFSGTMGEMHSRKICKILELAEKRDCQLSGYGMVTGSAQEGVTSLGPNGEMLDLLVSCSGKVDPVYCTGNRFRYKRTCRRTLRLRYSRQTEREDVHEKPLRYPRDYLGEVDEDTLGELLTMQVGAGLRAWSPKARGAFDIAAEILSFLPDHTMAEPPRLSMVTIGRESVRE